MRARRRVRQASAATIEELSTLATPCSRIFAIFILNARASLKAVSAKRKSFALIALLIVLPVLLISLVSSGPTLDGYDDLPAAADPVILSLLNGEQLVPPPALPPEVFMTREVAAERIELASASREWALLDADFRQRLLAVYRMMERHGYQMALVEGYRSPMRQEALASIGQHVTNARAFQSYHQFGLAADNGFYRDGRLVISEKDSWAMAGYRLYGQYAESVGLTWGGRWQMRDFGHVELRRQISTSAQRK
ncbi:M15 family peptidase [Noviherbaspirillum saxi]|uniref:M15 family peptidase n=2 Tax=Noviherbaspirillum saxi TaxID=2320863 RepID=A0A3A3FQ67_9BURK|nr:M15 family peptidase [Noviherbaspirillum saxi]